MPDTITNQPEVQRIEGDEIDLNEVFSKIWRRRKFILSFVLISIVLVMGISAIQYLITPVVKTHSINIRFNFASSVQGTYPSGQRFSKNDLITTAILKEIYDNNGLAAQNVPFDHFVSHFSVAPFAVNSKFIQRKFDSLLANKKLTHTEISSIETQYVAELKSAQANFAKVSYVDSDHLGLTQNVIEKILIDIPRVWSAVSIKDLGVLDLKVPGKQFYQTELVDHYEYLQGIQYMINSAKKFTAILEVLEKDDLGGFVKDPETDMVVSDIQVRLDNIIKFELTPIYSVISNVGLVKEKDKAKLYLTNQIELLHEQMNELAQKSKIYKEAMMAYDPHSKDTSSNFAQSQSARNGGMVQYGDDFLSKIVEMVDQKKDTEYRQNLLSEHIKLRFEYQEMKTQRAQLQRAEKVLIHQNGKLLKYVEDYPKHIKEMNTELVKLIEAYHRILELRNMQLLGKSSSLYELASDRLQVESNFLPKIKKVMLVSIVSAFLALMLSVFIALVVKERKQTSD